MKKIDYNKKIDEYIDIIKESLAKKDFDMYHKAIDLFENTVAKMESQKLLESEISSNNFGLLNNLFENVLPELFKKDRKLIGRVMRTIKEDKNLLSQFQFYNALRNYNGNTDSTVFVKTALSLTESKLDKKSVIKSNRKFAELIKENGIYPDNNLSEDEKIFFESCNNLLTKRETLSNINTLAESLCNVSNYINKHKAITTDKVDLDEMLSKYDKTLKNNLNEEERSLVMDITNINNKNADVKREKLLNKFKKDSLAEIHKLMDSTEDGDEKESLKSLEEQINSMEYCPETIVKDLAKLIEIYDILKDK